MTGCFVSRLSPVAEFKESFGRVTARKDCQVRANDGSIVHQIQNSGTYQSQCLGRPCQNCRSEVKLLRSDRTENMTVQCELVSKCFITDCRMSTNKYKYMSD